MKKKHTMAKSKVRLLPPLLISLVILNSSQVNSQELVSGAHPPQFTGPLSTSSKNHFVQLLEGPANRFHLECKVKAVPEAEISWFKNDLKIEDDLEGITFPSPDMLEFSEPRNVHEGRYHCTANNSMGLAVSEVILVAASKPIIADWWIIPKLTTQPEVAIKQLDVEAKFHCEANTHAKIKWTFNGKVLEAFSDKNELTIPSVFQHSVGTYACNASNQAGYDYKSVYLNILTQAPIIVETPRNRTVALGQETILRCRLKGYPEPSLQWFFEGNAISNESDNYMISGSGDLTILKVTADMEGEFQCKATNQYGSRTASARLKVVSTTTIVNGPSDVSVQVTGTVRINCTVLWDPAFELEVNWKKDNVDLHPDGIKVTIDPIDKFLTIRDITFGDEGTYTCVATTNTNAGAVTDSGTLTVTGIPPTLILPPSDEMTVAEGADVSINCKVDGLPRPWHRWLNGTERINLASYNDRITMDEFGTLHIKDVTQDDNAKYICRAENGYGFVTGSSWLKVRRRSRIVVPPKHALYTAGQDVTFDCVVDIDPKLKKEINPRIEWFRDGQKLDQVLTVQLDSNETLDTYRYLLYPNATLLIKKPSEEDLGTYRCQVNSGIDEVKLEAVFYNENDQNWLMILIIIIICILLLVLLSLCIICVRKRARRKGRYGVKDVADGKRTNRSDIQYSIDDDTESLHKDADPESRTPIIKPSSRQLSNNSDLKGSENSLLNMTDEDLWLRKGMDEDGSFRQVYIKE